VFPRQKPPLRGLGGNAGSAVDLESLTAEFGFGGVYASELDSNVVRQLVAADCSSVDLRVLELGVEGVDVPGYIPADVRIAGAFVHGIEICRDRRRIRGRSRVEKGCFKRLELLHRTPQVYRPRETLSGGARIDRVKGRDAARIGYLTACGPGRDIVSRFRRGEEFHDRRQSTKSRWCDVPFDTS